MRRTSISIAVILAVAATVSGCALHNIHSGGDKIYPANNEVPVAANFRTSMQLKLQAAEHWRRVANDSAGVLAKAMQKGATVYVRRNCDTTGCAPRACDTTFNRVFHNEFTTALVEQGPR